MKGDKRHWGTSKRKGYLQVGILSDDSGASLEVARKALFHARMLGRLVRVRIHVDVECRMLMVRV